MSDYMNWIATIAATLAVIGLFVAVVVLIGIVTIAIKDYFRE